MQNSGKKTGRACLRVPCGGPHRMRPHTKERGGTAPAVQALGPYSRSGVTPPWCRVAADGLPRVMSCRAVWPMRACSDYFLSILNVWPLALRTITTPPRWALPMR